MTLTPCGKNEFIGRKFGRLEVIKFVCVKNKNSRYLCRCECGNERIVSRCNLVTGHSKSCGCLRKGVNKTHGMSGTPIFRIWIHLLDRCNKKTDAAYKNYGGRGIKACSRWYKFENFYNDMGDKPQDLTLERIDNNKGYCPENCRWATRKEQANNTRRNVMLTYRGKTQNITQWAEEIGINVGKIRNRLNLGWSIKKTLTTN